MTMKDSMKQQLIDAYNAGYNDREVNHINDAENYASDCMYGMDSGTVVFDQDKINRIEFINHANNRYKIGRIFTMYQDMDDFNSVEVSIQDDGMTMKVFIS